MIDIYLTDEIQIIKISQNSWGKENRITIDEIARVEATNKILLGRDGQEVKGNFTIILKEDSEMEYHYKIKILKLNGSDFYQKEKKWIPLKISKWNNFIDTHVEVEV